jgi:hypothetical protein
VLALGLAGTAAAAPVVQPAAKKQTKVLFFKGRISSDGFLTPGQPETVTVFHMPAKTDFKLGIEPPPITLQCGQFYFCDIARALPAPGSAPFRTSKKGVAVVSFLMPSTYNVATDPFDPRTRTPVAWANGQRVHIDVQGIKRLPHKRLFGFGSSRVQVQTG